MDKIKNASDHNLIINLFGIDTMDWSRRINGDLVFLTEAGQKFVYTNDELDELAKDKKLKKDFNHLTPKDQKIIDKEYQKSLEKEVKQLTEIQAPYTTEESIGNHPDRNP